MIGFNGGLIGKDRTTTVEAAVGVWTPREQIKARRTNVWPIIGEIDPYFSSVSLLLHGNGTNGSTTITDSSSNAVSVIPYGNTAISTTQSKFGGGSIYFDGTGDYALPAAGAGFTFGLDAFTIETWIYLDGSQASYAGALGGGPTSAGSFALFSAFGNAKLTLNIYSGPQIIAPTTLLNQWVHVAVVREGTGTDQTKMYINGTSAGSMTYSTNITFNSFVVGRSYVNENQEYMNGFIDELRVTKGVARYTADFTAPIAPFPDA
jgi:hypothetical protein